MRPETLDLVSRLSLLLVASLVFIILGLAGVHFFRRPVRARRLRFRLHHGAGLIFGALHMSAAALAPLAGVAWVAVAIGLYLGGLALFFWTQETVKHAPPYLAFSGVTPEHLFVNGPYRFIRHPFYLAFSVILFAVPAATWNPWLLASALLMTMTYVSAAREEEAAFVRTPYADRHRAYMRRTGMFAPRARALVLPGLNRRWLVAAIILAMALAAALFWELLDPERAIASGRSIRLPKNSRWACACLPACRWRNPASSRTSPIR